MPPELDYYRQEFPLVRHSAYLNHAAVSPLPCRVVRAMNGLLEDVQQFGSAHFDHWIDALENARSSAARLLNADPGEIALIQNTSEGVSLFANGLEWKAGDEVVSVEGEFPANYYRWKALEKEGVRLRLVRPEAGETPIESFENALTPRTRVVAVSFVQFLSGYRLNLLQLGKLCADHGVLLFVDAIQGWGAFPVDVKAAQIAGLTAGGHKWLMGPAGCGILFVRRNLAEKMEPSSVGWFSVQNWEDFTPHELAWRPAAGRFEYGTPNLAGVYGLGAALSLLEEAGLEFIAGRVAQLTARLRGGLLQTRHRIYGPADPEVCSGIVTFVPRRGEAEDIVRQLADRGVTVSARCGMVRVSPHFYNTEAEIDRVLELLS
jgi:cysteine desulfurase / selenocysteine lyase